MMARHNVFNLRLSDDGLERLNAYAQSKEISPAEVLPDYIKRLAKSKTQGEVSRKLRSSPN